MNYKGETMKIIILIYVSICFFCSLLNSTIIEIKQDGTGDFTIIQEGINASVNNDTILVYPGIYYENLMIENKSITLASLYLTTEDENYINSTKIDGNHLNSVIRVLDVETGEIQIMGFVIQHGECNYDNDDSIKGGGIYSEDILNLIIKKCKIKNNKAVVGGGLYNKNTQINLLGNTINNNQANEYGGGICTSNSELNFDSELINNIYLNYASIGSDIWKSPACPVIYMIVDTFTVIDPDQYYLFASDSGGNYIPGEITYNIISGKIEQVNDDLYVNPDGDDDNTGLTEFEPLKTIAYALAMVRSDTLNPNSVYLADGVYSSSINGQYFPLQPKNAVSIIGESMYNTILDAENLSGHIYGWYKKNYYEIKDLKLINGYKFSSIQLRKNKDFLLENIYVSNCHFIRFYDVIHISESNSKLVNVQIKDNSGSGGLSFWGSLYSHHITIENCIIKNNTQADHPDIFSNCGVHMTKSYYLDTLIVDILNTEITENTDYNIDWPTSCPALSVSDIGYSGFHNVNLVNCTIGNNFTSWSTGGAVRLSEGVSMNIINSVLYGDHPMEILLDGSDEPTTLNVSYSLVEDDEWGIGLIGNNTVNWQDGNLDENPDWDIDGEFPYALTSTSPCIDTGTLDLPEGIELPEFDLAGNPRIVGETVDMGAYEYQGTNTNEELIINNERINMSVYPNPFQPNSRDHRTSIRFNLLESCTVNLDIYNVKGQKVKSLMDAYASRGEYTCRWDGKDDNGKRVSSGQYICKLMVDDEMKAVRKIVVIGK